MEVTCCTAKSYDPKQQIRIPVDTRLSAKAATFQGILEPLKLHKAEIRRDKRAHMETGLVA